DTGNGLLKSHHLAVDTHQVALLPAVSTAKRPGDRRTPAKANRHCLPTREGEQCLVLPESLVRLLGPDQCHLDFWILVLDGVKTGQRIRGFDAFLCELSQASEYVGEEAWIG